MLTILWNQFAPGEPLPIFTPHTSCAECAANDRSNSPVTVQGTTIVTTSPPALPDGGEVVGDPTY